MDDKQNHPSVSIHCPECDTTLLVTSVKMGKIIECHACGTESEIVVVSPLKLSPLEEEK